MKKIYRQSFKKSLLFAVFLFVANICFSQITYTWNQTGTADWTVAANWTPARTTPAANDILLFNNGANTTATNIPTQTIGQLSIRANTIVNLQAAAAATILTISDLAGTDLSVITGCELNLNAATNTTITLATGATGIITGNITFSNAAHKLDAVAASGISFNSPAVFTQGTGCGGNVFTAAGTDNAIVFNSGSTFNQLAGATPFAKVQPASKVVFNTGSLFHFQVPSSTPSFSGRIYADLQFSGSGTAATTTGANAVSIDNLTVSTGTLNFNMTGTPGHAIKGNISVAAGATLNFTPASAATVNLNGTATQSITNNGALSFGANQTVNVNNTAGVVINSPIAITNTLNLAAGNVTIGNNNLTAGSVTGTFSATTHVVTNGTGKLIQTSIGAAAKIFPIGHDAANYNPVTISNGNNSNYGARVVEGFTYPIFDGNRAVNRTWFVQADPAPPATVNVDFGYTMGHANPGFIYGNPVDHGVYTTGWNINQTGLVPTGTYNVATQVASFVGGTELPMVIGNLGSILAATTNCFPKFAAQKNSGSVYLNWTINCPNPVKQINVERSANGRSFEIVSTTQGIINDYTDNQLLAGNNYYRIKLTDINGKVFYSSIAAIINNSAGFEIVSLMPNIVINSTQLNLTASKKTTVNIVIANSAGIAVSKLTHNLAAGSSLLDIDVANLPAGMYYITATTTQGDVSTAKLIKQ